MLMQILMQNTTRPWWQVALQILAYFFAAWIVQLLSRRLARLFIRVLRLAPVNRERRPEREKMLLSLLSSIIIFMGYFTAMIAAAAYFVSATTLVWVVGLFSAAFGLSVRPIVSDLMTGIGFLFEDTFAVGEKVEILGMEGVIEAIQLRITLLRASSGEVYVIPNGEIRVVRNFSRGHFSLANITLKVEVSALSNALEILQSLGEDAVSLLPNLLEPWQVISKSETLGQQAELTILAKARFGKAAEMRPRMQALIQERLMEQNITLLD